jgi:DNA-binding CsgD family transcriptional regulator
MRALRNWFNASPATRRPVPELTRRELEILDQLAAGLSRDR